MPRSAYLHIPFCRRRCYYCDFPVSVVGDRPGSWGEDSGTINQYIRQMCEEIKATSVRCARSSAISAPRVHRSAQPLSTVFLGGGTPSLLSVGQLAEILHVLDRHLGIAAGAEISMEMDPGTFDRVQLQGYHSAGVNRVSLGVQAFQAELLHSSGRSHSVTDIFAAVDCLGQVGVENFSLDLISGLPHQTIAQWQESLEKAVAIGPTHISTYDLVVEPVTAFGRWYSPGVAPLPPEETTAQMYRLAQQVLTDAGYQHYEISNYAKPGYQCRHNRVYWENRPYYGFGMGAASYVNRVRFTRPRRRSEYYQWIATGCVIDDAPVSDQDLLLETLMLGLRLAEGLSLESLRQRFGEATLARMETCLKPYVRKGWVEVVRQGYLRLSSPEGFLFSNTVLADLFNLTCDLVKKI